MLVLHAIWPDSVGELHLWAEDPSRPPAGPKGAASDHAPPHPFAADPDDLDEALRGVLADVVPLADLEVEDVAILLPSSATGPRSSAQLLRDERVEDEPVERLTAWTVPAFVLPPAAASVALAHLRDPERVVGAPLLPAASVLCLAEVERLARRLAHRGAWVPALLDDGGEPVARWRPFGLTGAERRAVRALAHALPPSARAELPWGAEPSPEHGWHHQASSALSVVRSALQTFVDHHVRTRRAVRPEGSSTGRSSDAVGAFLTALTADYPVLDRADAAEVEALRQRLLAWTTAARLDAPVRTCFRVVPPDAEDDLAPSDAWSIAFSLQSRDDPSLFAPAEDVWAGATSAQLLATSGADPQEHLLASLGIAARLHAPLERPLTESAPCALTTDAAGAWAFLTEAVPASRSEDRT